MRGWRVGLGGTPAVYCLAAALQVRVGSLPGRLALQPSQPHTHGHHLAVGQLPPLYAPLLSNPFSSAGRLCGHCVPAAGAVGRRVRPAPGLHLQGHPHPLWRHPVQPGRSVSQHGWHWVAFLRAAGCVASAGLWCQWGRSARLVQFLCQPPSSPNHCTSPCDAATPPTAPMWRAPTLWTPPRSRQSSTRRCRRRRRPRWQRWWRAPPCRPHTTPWWTRSRCVGVGWGGGRGGDGGAR